MTYPIRRAAVIGAGTMGSALAAHLANVGIPVDLFDIVPRELTPEEQAKGLTLQDPVVRNRIVRESWERTLKARPAALYSQAVVPLVRLCNLEDDFDRLAEADWICEAIVERLDIKQDLMARLEKVRKSTAIIATNTSGLLIREIADGRSKAFQEHFLGMHFFNPPRYLKLLEIIPHERTLPEVLEAMAAFGETVLGKGVVFCKDTPNFIANRFLSATLSYDLVYTMENGFTVEEVDALCGPLIGHPRTGLFRLLDLIGLDVMAHVNTHLYDAIPNDETRDLLRHPEVYRVMSTMVERGWYGNKVNQGFYKRVDMEDGSKEFWTVDFTTLEHTPPAKVRFDSVGAHRKTRPLSARLKAMVEAEDRAADFVRSSAYFRMAYSSRRIPEIADDLVSLDRAVKWGFVYEMGPFEEWDALGVAETAEKMEAAGFEVAGWVKEMLAGGFQTFYQYNDGLAVGYYDLATKGYVPFEARPREIKVAALHAEGREVDGNSDASLLDMGDGVLLLEVHSPANTISAEVYDMGFRALELLESDYNGLVIGNDGELFSGGANLDMQKLQASGDIVGTVEGLVKRFQDLTMAMRYAPKPVVTAPFDRTLAGGAELALCGARIVAAAELYIGFVEFGVGLIPSGGGCKEMLRRVVNPAMRVPGADPIPVMQKVFEIIGLVKIATSAMEAREFGYLTPADRIVVNRDHLLSEAKAEALHLFNRGYRPPAPEPIYAAGRDVLSAMDVQLTMMEDAGWISAHDHLIAGKLAFVLCGGDFSEPSWVDEQYILDLERAAFVALIQEPKTIERIVAMLTTGKPLRN
jgi:3-hydroxyacyl-CoA dehydrogenase